MMDSNGIQPVMEVGNGGYGNGFGGDGYGFWFIILILILGWGRNGFGGYGNGSGADANYVLTSDFAQLSRQIADTTAMTERKLDGINNGLCSLGYQELQNITGVNNNIFNSTSALTSAITNGGFETRNAIQGIGTQMAQCCCDLRSDIANVKFENAQNTCAITNTMTLNTRDIIDNQNANYRALHDEIIANRLEDKNAQIQAMQNEINSLRLASSQCSQNAYLIDQLKPAPRPSYIVQSPYCNCNCNPCGNCGI